MPPRTATAVILLAVMLASARAKGATAQECREKDSLVFSLVHQGKYEQALLIAGRRTDRVEGLACRRAWQAKDAGKTDEAIELYWKYFYYCPYRTPRAYGDTRSWNSAAFALVELLKLADKNDDVSRQTRAAAAEYRKLVAAAKKSDGKRCKTLADGIVSEHPKSLFAPMAAITAANHAFRDAAFERRNLYIEYLDQLAEAGASPRSRVLLLFAVASTLLVTQDNALQAIDTYERIEKLTTVGLERRICLMNRARYAALLDTPEGIKRTRELFRKFLERYPDAWNVAQARLDLIRSYLEQEGPDEALKQVRALGNEAPAESDLSEPLFAVAKGYFQTGKHKQALDLMDECIERFPRNERVALIHLGMAEVHETIGDEKKMLQAYIAASGMKSVDTATNIMDSSNSSNRAFHFLGGYYMGKGKYGEALKWYRGWSAASWCGTCEMAMESDRARRITLCLLNLGRTDKAARRLEKVVFGEEYYGSMDVACRLVDVWIERGKLAELTKRLEAAALDEENVAAKTALDYIGLSSLAEKRDIAGLWRILHRETLEGRAYGSHLFDDENPLPALSREALRLLLAMPEETRALARKKLHTKGNEQRWAALVLGLLKDPELLPTVSKLLSNAADYYTAGDLLYALRCLDTPEAHALIAKFAKQDQDEVIPEAARLVQERHRREKLSAVSSLARVARRTDPQ